MIKHPFLADRAHSDWVAHLKYLKRTAEEYLQELRKVQAGRRTLRPAQSARLYESLKRSRLVRRALAVPESGVMDIDMRTRVVPFSDSEPILLRFLACIGRLVLTVLQLLSALVVGVVLLTIFAAIFVAPIDD